MSQPLPVHVIQGAIEILSDKKRWCHGATARDLRGIQVDAYGDHAHSFCAVGAIMRTAFQLGMPPDEANRMTCRIVDAIGRNQRQHIATINDAKGREAAIAALQHHLKETA